MSTPHDPAVEPESEGIPDLQDGWPEQEEAVDPQRESVPGDRPTVAQYRGNTAEEAHEGDSLAQRLAEESPEGPVEQFPAAEADTAARDDMDGSAEDAEAYGPPEEQAGLLSDDPDPVRPRNQDLYATDSPATGLSAEEEAVHITDQDSALTADRGHARAPRGWENSSALADEATPDEDDLATGALPERHPDRGTGEDEPLEGASGAPQDIDTTARARRTLRDAATGRHSEGTAPTGNDAMEQEIAEGPVEGVEPGEDLQRGPWHPPLYMDTPASPGVPGAQGDPDAVRRQKDAGGP